ncbi:MAG TPA: crosslink repair DNA glycosylase YcaQ family protein, partial [Arthrobacter sp.]|nr:crosslink repair DNA glycosylase YcaQ family protein [Arthrobacter sp.]
RTALPGSDAAALADGSDPPHLLAVAALLPNKDQALLLAALSDLTDLPWTASLTGSDTADPVYAARLRDMVNRLGLQDRIRIPGELRGGALEAEWAAADLSLLISQAETFGLVVTESIARGVPVVVRAGTGAVEALAAGTPAPASTATDSRATLPGTAVALGTDPAPLTEVLRRWLSEPGLRTRWRAAAVDARDRLPGWDATARTVLAALDREHRAAQPPAAPPGAAQESRPRKIPLPHKLVDNDPMTPQPLTTHLRTANAPPARTLTRERLRAWAWHKQGLDGSLAGCTAEQVFARAGWARSVGGANPYLTLFARAGIRREQVDADVLAHRILELPTARGCTYVLGRDDFAWALTLSRDAAEAAVKVVGRLGVDRGEIALLEEQVLHTLAEAAAPMDPRQLKEELGESVRNLGEEGKRKGATTTLPTALGILQSQGRIRRVPATGRLDQQRYAYELWNLPPSPLDDDQARTELIRRYLGWTGGATFKQSQWFTAFTVAQSKAALASVGAVEVPTAAGETLWMLPDDVEQLAAFQEPEEEQIQLLAGTDSLALLRRNAADLLAEEDQHMNIPGSLALQADLPDHPIVDRGRIIGLWQYDPGTERIAPWVFRAPTAAVTRRIAEIEDWIREDLGDFRAFSLDSPASRQARIDALAAAGGPAT